MQSPRERFAERLMSAVLALYVSLGLVRGAYDWVRAHREETYHGPNTGILSSGQSVVTLGGPAVMARKVNTYYEYDFDWESLGRSNPLVLAAGVPADVRYDGAGDEDDCGPNRPVVVQVLEGEQEGAVFAVRRDRLRKR